MREWVSENVLEKLIRFPWCLSAPPPKSAGCMKNAYLLRIALLRIPAMPTRTCVEVSDNCSVAKHSQADHAVDCPKRVIAISPAPRAMFIATEPAADFHCMFAFL